MTITRGWPEDDTKVRLRKAFVYADTLRLTDDERHELAQLLPGVDKDDGGSWRELNPNQLNKLLDMFESYLLVQSLLAQRA